MRAFIKKISHPFLKFLFNKYHSKPREYSYKDVSVLVHPDVFPPHFTISTKILLDFINELDLTNKSILELGCGSGIISLFAAYKGGVVTASDINPTAIDFLNTAASKNELKVNALFSDLFQNISQKEFDYIIINPPYYPKNPSEMKERAWFCGEDFIYFENLFLQLIAFIPNSSVLMILSEDCEIETIKAIASKNKLEFLKVHETKVSFERNFIFSITKTD